MRQVLINYIRYNHWANGRLAELLEHLPGNILDAPVKSSFSSVRKTVHHIWDAELTWLARLRGETLPWPPTASFATPGIAEFVNTSAEWITYIEGVSDEFLSGSCTYRNTRGEPFTTPVSGIVMHCMNHSTFHRGQLVTMLRELDATEKLPQTDLIAYLRLQTT